MRGHIRNEFGRGWRANLVVDHVKRFAFLRQALDLTFFPELFEVRTVLGEKG